MWLTLYSVVVFCRCWEIRAGISKEVNTREELKVTRRSIKRPKRESMPSSAKGTTATIIRQTRWPPHPQPPLLQPVWVIRSSCWIVVIILPIIQYPICWVAQQHLRQQLQRLSRTTIPTIPTISTIHAIPMSIHSRLPISRTTASSHLISSQMISWIDRSKQSTCWCILCLCIYIIHSLL